MNDKMDPKAVIRVAHVRPKSWRKNPTTGLLEPDYRWVDDPVMGPMGAIDPDSCELVDEDETHNLVTNTGRVYMHTQCYATTGIGANGFNFIGLTNNATAPAASDSTLTAEITTNGLGRAQGVVVLASGSGTQTTVAKTFTASGTQSAQKTALFTAVSSGTMNHEALLSTARSLLTGDALAVTFTITM